MLSNDALKLVSLMFEPGESVCLSPNKFAYLSVTQDKLLNDTIYLTSNNGKINRGYPSKSMSLLSLNPVRGSREDVNVVGFRSFLVECDDIPLEEQLDYINSTGLPYSACIFSGNRSLHFLVTLSEDLPDLNTYRFYARWIVGAIEKADKNTVNPTRGIRIPDHVRDTGKIQKLIKIGRRIDKSELDDWLSGFMDKKPSLETEKVRVKPEHPIDVSGLPRWIQNAIEIGPKILPDGRNRTWFILSLRLAEHGWSYEQIIDILDPVFTPEYDFDRREWERAIESGVKTADKP